MKQVKSFIKSRQKLVIAVVIILALALPFIVNQVLKQQDIRQRADTANPVTMTLSPTTKTVDINETFDVILTSDTNGNDISALEGYLTFSSNVLNLTEVVGGQNYTVVANTSDQNSSIVIYNNSAQPSMGPNVTIATFRFKAVAAGSSEVKFGSKGVDRPLRIAASGSSTNIPLSSAGEPKGNYTVSTNVSPTRNQDQPPTPTFTPIPTNHPTTIPGTITPTNSPTPTSTPVPTATLAPTATPIPGDTTLSLKVQLPGIGNGPVNLGLNSTPIHPQRETTVEIFDNTNTKVKTVNGIMTYNNSSSNYEGTFSLGPDFSTGSYSVKVKLTNTLLKLIPGIVQITKGASNQSSSTSTLITGDLNNDNTLGVFDWTFMIACVKNESSCTADIEGDADLNDNGSIDELDVQILQRGFAIRDGD
jgi:hypothetical protein